MTAAPYDILVVDPGMAQNFGQHYAYNRVFRDWCAAGGARSRFLFSRHVPAELLAEFPGGGHTRVNLLGRERAHPILFAPVGHLRLAHPEGELAVAMAAAATGTIQVVSTMADMARVRSPKTVIALPPAYQPLLECRRTVSAGRFTIGSGLDWV